MFDTHSNFAYGTIATAPSPGTSGTAIVLGTSTFAQFPDPGTGFEYNCTVWPYGTLPLDSNAEIVRVKSKGTNGTIGVARGQESSNNIDIQEGYQVAITWTKKKATDIEQSISDGWVPITKTLTYASGTSIKIDGDYTSNFRKGTKFKFSQGGTTEYFTSVSGTVASGTTTIGVVGDVGTPVVNTSISDAYYSRNLTPVDFPSLFSWTPTVSGFSTNPTGSYKFSVKDTVVVAVIDQSADGTSNATNFTLTLPVAMDTDFSEQRGLITTLRDAGTLQPTPGMWLISGTAPSLLQLFKDAAQTPWTNTGGKRARLGVVQYSF